MADNCLYVVATPIGNLEDMTARALRILSEVDIIAAEDTRHSRGLLSHFGIKTPMVSCHKFNEESRSGSVVAALQAGKSVALVSDAGTPCISDPGYKLVQAVAAAGFPVVAVCGASAVVAAVSISGFDVSHFSFIGFLPRAKADILKSLEQVLPGTVVFYESPKRVQAALTVIAAAFPTATACLCNDLTKKFERAYRGNLVEILQALEENHNAKKGEYACVLHVSDMPKPTQDATQLSIEAELVDIIVKNGGSLKDAATILKQTHTTLGKKEIYAATLNLKKLF